MKKQLSLEQTKNLLVELYKQQSLTVDHLPYTDEFECIYNLISLRSRDNLRHLNRHAVWELLIFLRKAGRLELKDKPSKPTAKPLQKGLFEELRGKV